MTVATDDNIQLAVDNLTAMLSKYLILDGFFCFAVATFGKESFSHGRCRTRRFLAMGGA